MELAQQDRNRRLRGAAAAAAVVLALLAGAAPAQAAAAPPAGPAAAADALDRAALTRALDAVHEAGVYGAYASVRDGRTHWSGATGLADRDTGRPTAPGMRHRVGSVTKSFTAVAVLQQSARGRIGLDRPVADYVPDLLPGERGRKVTVRMLMNHTSGIADYIGGAFPSLMQNSTASLDEFRHRTLTPGRLIALGTVQPQLFEPGSDWSYSNTNYVLLGEVLRKATGEDPEKVITRDVIRRAGLRDTYFPGTTERIKGPHAGMYENWYGLIDPPRDYADYNMTWGGTAGALVSTTDDLTAFYRALFQGRLLPAEQVRQMRTTVPVKDPGGTVVMRYGLGLLSLDTPCGPVWGHDGAVFGAGTSAMTTADGARQYAVGYNLMKYQRFDAGGKPVPHPADAALGAFALRALCPASDGARSAAAPKPLPEPLDSLPVKGLTR
ncbi:serine hydrolase domain-containing protein [Streptomyces sp. NPDC093801]|uniref:serine hydrolase domain-containing protein n=1 Tax=Streptomyces sp. NPDC093801 TaxID=3155203 RepID=UPI00344F03B5